jgi:hypothetical protein
MATAPGATTGRSLSAALFTKLRWALDRIPFRGIVAIRFNERTANHMKNTHLIKARKDSNQTPFTFLKGFGVECDGLRKTVPPALIEQGVFYLSVHTDGQDLPFDPTTNSIFHSVNECERVSFAAACAALEDGQALGLGIILRVEDGLCMVRLTSDDFLEPNNLPDEVAAIISNLNAYTFVGSGGKTITILCQAVKPEGFLSGGILADGTEIVVSDRDCFVPLSVGVLQGGRGIPNRQDEILKLCADYVDPRCPIVGTDGAVKGIVPAVLAYSDRREDFLAEWNRRVAKHKRVRARVLPAEFVASMEMVGHLMGVDA